MDKATEYDPNAVDASGDGGPSAEDVRALQQAANSLNGAASDDGTFQNAARSMTAWTDAAKAYVDVYGSGDVREGSAAARKELNSGRFEVASACDAALG